MLVKISTEPRFFTYLRQSSFNFHPKQAETIRNLINPSIMNVQSQKPFTANNLLKYSKQKLQQIILHLAIQADQFNLRNFNFQYVLELIMSYFKDLGEILATKDFYCEIFCLTITKFLQEFIKANFLSQIDQRIKRSFIIDLLLNTFDEAKRSSNYTKRLQSKRTNRILFQTLLSFASFKYICQSNADDLKEKDYLNKALKVSVILVELVETESQFDVTRDFVVYASHLFVFNALILQPMHFYEFCRNKDEVLMPDERRIAEEISAELENEFICSLYEYAKTDPLYLDTLLRMFQKLMELRIRGQAMVKLFSVLAKLVKSRLFPLLKIRVYKMLIDYQDKKYCQQIDQFYEELLERDTDLGYNQTEKLNYRLATTGGSRRKIKFTETFYNFAMKNNKRLQTNTVNLMLWTVLDCNLKMPDFQIFLEKQALYLDPVSLKKLHRTIFSTKNQTYLLYLDRVIGKKFLKSPKNAQQIDLSCPFLQEEWLQAEKDSCGVFQTYLKIIVETATSETITLKKSKLQNLNSLVVQIHPGYYPLGLRYYPMISKMATNDKDEQSTANNAIFSPQMFKYMLICQAMFGDKLEMKLYRYFFFCFGKIKEDSDLIEVLEVLQYLVRIFKNKSAVLIYLQAILEFQRSQSQFYTKKLYDIQFLASLILQSTYFRISTYSIEAFTILLQLSVIIKQQSFLQDARVIFEAWSSLMTRNECKRFNYLFCFREIKKIFPMKEKFGKNSKERIVQLWALMIKLMDKQSEPLQFLRTAENKVVVVWTGDQTLKQTKKGLFIEGNILKNHNINLNWNLFTVTTSFKTYSILITNDRYSIYQKIDGKNSKQPFKQDFLKQFNKSLEKVHFVFYIQESWSSKTKPKVFLEIAGHPIEFAYDGYFQQLLLQIDSEAFLQNLAIKNIVTGDSLTSFTKHLNEINQWQVRIGSLSKVVQNSFINKVDFQLIFYLLGEMLKNVKQYNISQGLKMFIRVSCRLFKYLKKLQDSRKRIPYEIQVMNRIFDLVRKGMANFRSGQLITFTIQLQLQNPLQYSFYLYHFYVSALLPEELWRMYSQPTKKYLIQLLARCLHNNQFKAIENTRIDLFELLCGLDYDLEITAKIINNSILNHELNKILTFKFQHYISLAQYSKKIAEKITSLLSEMISSILSEHQNSQKKKLLCEYLIFQSNLLEIVFTFCSTQSKISLIYYYTFYQPASPNSSQKLDKFRLLKKEEIAKIKELVGIMSHEQRSDFILLLITELKQDSLPKSEAIRLSVSQKKTVMLTSNHVSLPEIGYINLYLLAKLWDSIHKDSFEDVITVLSLYLTKRVELEEYTTIIHLLTENTLCTQEYVKVLFEIETKHKKQHPFYQKALEGIINSSLALIVRSQKKKFLKFMHQYLEYATLDLSFALIPLRFNYLDSTKLGSHCIILQYIYELLIKLKYKFHFNNQEERIVFRKTVVWYIHLLTEKIKNQHLVGKPLFYVHPILKMMKQPTVQNLAEYVRQVEKETYLELKGGLYFKLILIVLQLLQTCISVDFTHIIQLLLLTKYAPQLTVPSAPKSRKSSGDQAQNAAKTPLEVQLDELEQQHRRYYLQVENGQARDIEVRRHQDLSYGFLEFFLLRLCQFLQNNTVILQEHLLKSYSDLVVSCLKHPRISGEICEENECTPYEMSKYQDIQCLSQGELKSPGVQILSRAIKNGKLGYGMSNGSIDTAQTPRKPRKKTGDFTAISKERMQFYDLLTRQPKNWEKLPIALNFTKYFGAKAKEIRFRQFLHIHHILSRQPPKHDIFLVDKSQQLASFTNKHSEQLRHYKSKLKQSIKLDLHKPLRKVKKIYPYTIPNRTVMRIMQIALSNMACPITQYMECRDYFIRRQISQESVSMETFAQEDDFISTPQYSNEGQLKSDLLPIEIEEGELKQPVAQFKRGQRICELITREGVYFCGWELRQRQKVLKLKCLQNKPSPKQFPNIIYGNPKQKIRFQKQLQFLIPFRQIEEVLYRKFTQIVNSIEIFMHNGTSRFILFYDRRYLDLFINYFQNMYKPLKVLRQPAKEFAQLGFTQKWVEGRLSNFQYIMKLNKYSGRTLNDLNQYYIFPWVLRDYYSSKIDLSDPSVFRDLSKPMGAQNPAKLARFRETFRQSKGGIFYGSHYSNQGNVLYFMVRLQPFSSLQRDLQSGQFDQPDRLFSSIQTVWQTIMNPSNQADIQELIPQLYYMPVLLKNIGNIDLGVTSIGQNVGHVALPPWASTPEQFVVTMRAALQSDQVSENLHLWIDLIFGKHQLSQQKNNIFLDHTYEEKVQEKVKQLASRPEQISKTLEQVLYYGQCPSKLFSKEHKPKKSNPDSGPRKTVFQIKRPLSQTQSQSNHDQALVSKGWKFSQIHTQNNKFYLQLQRTSPKKEYSQVTIDFSATFEELKENLESPKTLVRRRQQPNKFNYQQNSFTLDNFCLKNNGEIILALDTTFTYQHTNVNQLWIVCYGISGLRVYNWQQEQHWKWEKQEVSSVHLQATRMIFSTPTGKVCFYSFFDSRLQETQAIKQCCAMQIQVVSFPRLPSKMCRNHTLYKVLCVGDEQKVTIVGHTFVQTLNSKSLGLNR